MLRDASDGVRRAFSQRFAAFAAVEPLLAYRRPEKTYLPKRLSPLGARSKSPWTRDIEPETLASLSPRWRPGHKQLPRHLPPAGVDPEPQNTLLPEHVEAPPPPISNPLVPKPPLLMRRHPPTPRSTQLATGVYSAPAYAIPALPRPLRSPAARLPPASAPCLSPLPLPPQLPRGSGASRQSPAPALSQNPYARGRKEKSAAKAMRDPVHKSAAARLAEAEPEDEEDGGLVEEQAEKAASSLAGQLIFNSLSFLDTQHMKSPRARKKLLTATRVLLYEGALRRQPACAQETAMVSFVVRRQVYARAAARTAGGSETSRLEAQQESKALRREIYQKLALKRARFKVTFGDEDDCRKVNGALRLQAYTAVAMRLQDGRLEAQQQAQEVRQQLYARISKKLSKKALMVVTFSGAPEAEVTSQVSKTSTAAAKQDRGPPGGKLVPASPAQKSPKAKARPQAPKS